MTALQVTRLCVRALDVAVPLVVHGDELASAVTASWHGRLEGEESTLKRSRPVSVAFGQWGQADVTGTEIGEVLQALEVAVRAAACPAVAAETVILEAAAFSHLGSGATAVVVAASPTELRALRDTAGPGLVCVEEKLLGIRDDGRVVPFAASPGTRHHLASLVALERHPGHAGAPDVTVLDTVDGLAVLAPHAPYLSWLPLPLQSLASAVHRAGGARRVVHDDPASLGPLLHEILEGSPR